MTPHPGSRPLPRASGKPPASLVCKLVVPSLMICLAAFSLARGDSETKKPPLAPGIHRERVNLILIDVAVTDSQGRSVDDLRPEDFRLWVDGHSHPIASVELQRAGVEPVAPPPPGTGEGRPPAEPAPAPATPLQRRFVLFFDGLNSELGLRAGAIQAARQFLEKGLPAGDEVMVAGLGSELKIYQEFTADPGKMLAAVKAVESDPQIRNGGANQVLQHVANIRQALYDCDICSEVMKKHAVEMEAARSAREDRLRILRSLDSLRALVAYLQSGSRRSDLIYLTDGFASDPGAFYGAPNEPDLVPEILHLTREASAAQVVIHTINTQGMPSHQMIMNLKGLPDLNPKGIPDRQWQSLMESQASDTLATFALGTGGTASRLSNKFEPALERVERDSRVSYLLSYVPEGSPDGRYHSTKVEVARRGVKVRAKEGFVWLTDDELRERTLLAAHLSPEMFRDFSIGMETRSYPGEGGKAHVEIAIEVPDSSLLFIPEQGGHVARLEVGVILRQGKDLVADEFNRRIEAKLGEKDFQDRGTLILVARRDVPPGEFEAVAVVRDSGSGEIGTLRSPLKVPDFSSDRMAVSTLILESPEPGARRVDLFPESATDPEMVVPAVLRVFGRKSRVEGFCVVYHPQHDSVTGAVRIRATGSIQQAGKTVERVADSLHVFPELAPGSTLPLEFPLSLSGLPPGVYSLEVQVLDEVGRQGATQRVEFMVQ